MIDKREVYLGSFISCLGIFILQSSIEYGVGTWSEMGAGFFPMLISFLLLMIGVGIIFSKTKKVIKNANVSWRPLIGVSLSIAFFAATLKYIGYIPAVTLSVLIGSLTDLESKIRQSIVFSILISLFGWVVFIFGLGLPISPF